MVEPALTIDSNKIGKKGFPLHYQACGLEPPMKEAAVEAPPDPSPPGEDDYRRAIQDLIDMHAQSRRYDNGNSLATYVSSTIPQWAAEATAFVAWRDTVWAYAYAELDKVLAG